MEKQQGDSIKIIHQNFNIFIWNWNKMLGQLEFSLQGDIIWTYISTYTFQILIEAMSQPSNLIGEGVNQILLQAWFRNWWKIWVSMLVNGDGRCWLAVSSLTVEINQKNEVSSEILSDASYMTHLSWFKF